MSRTSNASVFCVWLVVVASTQAGEPAVARVAIYDHSDGKAKAPPNLIRILNEKEGFRCERLKPAEFTADRLKNFEIVIVPGGSGSLQAKKLGVENRNAIREFVKKGGGYVGICAGSYLATTQYEWSLGLLNAKVVDREHWARGTGSVTLSIPAAGRKLLGHDKDDVEVYYGQGPLLAPGDKKADGIPDPYEPLAVYKTEIAKKGAPKGVMPGTTAVARGTFGAGRVICFGPHPEVKTGPNHLVLNGVKWAAKRERTRIRNQESEVREEVRSRKSEDSLENQEPRKGNGSGLLIPTPDR